MVKMFKSVYVVFLTSSIIVGGSLLIGLYLCNQLIWGVLAAIVWVGVSYILCNKIARGKYIRLASIINDDCDVEKFVKTSQEVLDRTSAGLIRDMTKLHCILGYINYGDNEKAGELLEYFDDIEDRKISDSIKISYYNNLALYNCRIGEFDKSHEALNNIRSLIKNGIMKQELRDDYSNSCDMKDVALSLERGQLQKAEQILNHLDTVEGFCNYELIALNYNWAVLYKKKDELDKAKEKYQYVIDNCMNGYYVDEAKKFLEGEDEVTEETTDAEDETQEIAVEDDIENTDADNDVDNDAVTDETDVDSEDEALSGDEEDVDKEELDKE